jgi:hypothetical protein
VNNRVPWTWPTPMTRPSPRLPAPPPGSVLARLGRRVLAAGLAGIILGLVPLPAAAHEPDPTLPGGLYAQNQVLEFRWAPDGVPPVAMRSAILAAADDVRTSRASRAPTFTLDASGPSRIYYGVTVPCGAGGLACARRYVPTDFRVYFREQGHVFDWGTLRWCDLYDTPPNGCFDVEHIALHELGHVLGLDHHVNLPDGSDYLDAIMQVVARAKPRDGYAAHAYARCDVATLQRLYDVLGWTTPYSTCQTVPTSLGLATNGTRFIQGETATFTATLTTGSGFGRLSGNPVSGRRVVLQLRSAAGWIDVASMTPGATAGTYVLRRVVDSSADWRATFRAPGDEGLGGSTSKTVSLTVTGPCGWGLCPLGASWPGGR